MARQRASAAEDAPPSHAALIADAGHRRRSGRAADAREDRARLCLAGISKTFKRYLGKENPFKLFDGESIYLLATPAARGGHANRLIFSIL
jgi:hypothetical protein